MRLRPYKSCDAKKIIRWIKVGFVDKETVTHDRENIVEMAITRNEYECLKRNIVG